MKIIKFLNLFFLFIVLQSQLIYSQNKFEISVSSGFQMLGEIDINQGEININDSQFFEGNLAFRVKPEVLFEVFYIYQPSSISLDPFGMVTEFKLFDADIHYILAGGNYEKYFGRDVIAYGGFSIGAAGFVPNANFDSEWRLAFAGTLGLKFLLGRNFGIKLQAQGLFPVEWTGGNIWVGSGGVDYGISAGSSITQINVGGGIFFSL